MAKKLLLTGASGNLGEWLARVLSNHGFRPMRLTDIKPFPGRLPRGAEFITADLADTDAVMRMADGVDAILHFGGISTEQDRMDIAHSNIIGAINIFEAARKAGARVIFASSNHAIGFYERSRTISTHDPYRPDGYYGLSKAYGELLGRMMHDKHGVESVHFRIGTALPAPTEERHLATWLSRPDLLRAVVAAIEAPRTGHAVVWGISNNDGRWWRGDDAARIGFAPADNAADFAPLAPQGDAIAQRFQGGSFASNGYDRKDDDDPA